MAQRQKNREAADVLIIGAGASGSVAAAHLAVAGVKVVCLEQGPRVDSAEFHGDKPEWELMAQKRWHPNPNVRDLEADYPINTSESDVNPLMYSAVGGSTILYAAHWQRFMPSDFRVKTLDGVADDWPFTYEDLEPYYTRMDDEMGVSGLAGDPAYPPHRDYPLPPMPIGRIGMKAAEGMNKLGWHWWPGPNSVPLARLSRAQPVRALRHLPDGLPEQGEGVDRPHALAHSAAARRRARHRRPRARDHGGRPGARERRNLRRPQRPRSAPRGQASSSFVATEWARPGCC